MSRRVLLVVMVLLVVVVVALVAGYAAGWLGNAAVP
ncbi:hypothetical protein SAMN04488590_2752 [Microbacterium sp. 77mftsu3.1]|nr:hypothetical protein SAMN04488590_2752 [Microbacterium sp. 77mftsu3.1]